MNGNSYKIDFKHQQAAHCENGVTSNLLNHEGIKLSEPMVFGIGSGLFFSYMPFLKLNNLPVISFRPWPGRIFKRITKRLGVKVQLNKFKNADEAMNALDRNLEQGIPTGCIVGVYNLTYFPQVFRFHFNAHNLVVVGKENGEYLVSDPIMPGIERISYKDLQRVRYAKGTVFTPQGRMYSIHGMSGDYNLPEAIIKGIQACQAKTCLRSPYPFSG
jgi:hypothetical protein